MTARVRIELDDGTNTWVVVCPVEKSLPRPSEGVVRAAHDALAMFTESIRRDAEIVALHLRDAETLP